MVGSAEAGEEGSGFVVLPPLSYPLLDHYVWISYLEMWAEVRAFGSGLGKLVPNVGNDVRRESSACSVLTSNTQAAPPCRLYKSLHFVCY